VIDYRTGNLNEKNAHRLPGISRSSDLTLTRGLARDLSLSNLINSAPVPTVAVTLLDQSANPVWVLML
jgi:hypothetical protein